MSTPVTPSSPSPTGDDRNLVPVDGTYIAPPFEEKLRQFWAKNRTAVLVVCGVILLGIVGKGVWELIEARIENEIAADYAKAGTPEQLKTFAAAHPEHSLAGVAHLRLADEAFAAGKAADAVTHYGKATGIFQKDTVLAARAALGAAVAKVVAGDKAGGEAALKTISTNLNQPKAIRAEALYHLATLAADAGNSDEVNKLSDQLLTVDPNSLWAQRSLMLRTTAVGSSAASDPAPASGAGVTFPKSGK